MCVDSLLNLACVAENAFITKMKMGVFRWESSESNIHWPDQLMSRPVIFWFLVKPDHRVILNSLLQEKQLLRWTGAALLWAEGLDFKDLQRPLPTSASLRCCSGECLRTSTCYKAACFMSFLNILCVFHLGHLRVLWVTSSRLPPGSSSLCWSQVLELHHDGLEDCCLHLAVLALLL